VVPPEPTPVPTLQLPDAASADLELVLEGLLRSSEPLGGPVTAPPGDLADPSVTLALAPAQADAVLAAGAALLLDAESTPVARLSGARPAPPPDGGVRGRVERLVPPEAGLGLALRPSRVQGPPPTSVVVLRRPLLLDEVAPAARGSRALVVPVGGPSPDGVPAEVLLRCAEADGRALGLPVLAVPLTWRDAQSDDHLVRHLVRGLGAREATVARAAADDADGADEAGRRWGEALAALDDGAALPQALPAATAAELRRWRPPRAQRGLVVLLTGLSGSGKSTVARALHQHLLETGQRRPSLLDGDVVRRLLSSGLGFDADARDLNVRRIGFVAAEVARHGGLAVCAPIAPYERSRAAVRRMAQEVGGFVLVHVSTPLEECERRDLKGLYARARAGTLPGFTGVDDPYEVPQDADVVIDTSVMSRSAAVGEVLSFLRQGGWLPQEPVTPPA